ncbi:putative geranylgeranyl transferase type-2 subunit alpha [Apostichopus japonicus]|uniref:Geranylgeranyl transferase type-2 subunit alpha n=1 Tax=Stichopus japonicus TaxID=307972 RepID=A0A2G8K702_STIJA|nr:putative geranylgeranyl transferase type-2 subunit alpha [Apostichopus japonicus]
MATHGLGQVFNAFKHGRVKVKTTAQQQEEKRKEREKKLKAYTGATAIIFKKRAEKQYDQEGLKIAEEILRSNPDFYSLWNFRREVFVSFREQRPKEELQELFMYELNFLEGCLGVNHKSYGTWHHREWVLNNMPAPDWKREVQLCNLFLQYDERNFHCWDFRRFVISKAKVSAQDELRFTTEKINTNFSNYSSWHYRSKLLPLLYPDQIHPDRPTEETLLQEYELVQNAFFTDPNDQSGWFYHRWLLGRGEKQQSLRMLHVNADQKRLFVTFSQPVNMSRERPVTVLFNDKAVDGTSCWTVESKDERDQSSTWFTSQLSLEKTDILEQELESCKQLQELEEDNKWCILTVIFLMRALDPLKHATETLQYFDTLIKVDPFRKSYFEDLRSKFIMENMILEIRGMFWKCWICHLRFHCFIASLDKFHNNTDKLEHYKQSFVDFKLDFALHDSAFALTSNVVTETLVVSFLTEFIILVPHGPSGRSPRGQPEVKSTEKSQRMQYATSPEQAEC